MILDKNYEILIGHVNIKYYLSIGYNVNEGDKVLIDIKDLRKGTPIKVNVECDICGCINKIYLQKYYINYDKYNYYSCFKCSSEKRIKTNNIKYGFDNISQSDIIKNKKKETTFKNYGVDNISQSEGIKNVKCETMMKNYGVEYVFQSDKLQDNIKKTKLKKYGDKNYTNREKSKETCLEKYGVENPSQSEEIKNKKIETCLKNYGVEYSSQCDEIKDKMKKTCLEKYGVEYSIQNDDVYNKKISSGYNVKKFKNMFYQGTYELDFLEKYYNRITISKIKSIKYDFDNNTKKYYPDFFIPKLNLIVEIKSDYYYNKQIEKNLAKQKACLEQGYNFIFIINKDYSNFDILFLEH